MKILESEINIASQKEISMGALAQELIKQINPNAEIVCDKERLRPAKSEVNRLLGSNEKLKRLTGWEPRYRLEQGLGETIEFMRQNLERYKAEQYNV